MGEEEDRTKAKQSALRMLAFRPRSKQEIADKLSEKGFAAAIIQPTLDYLSSCGYVNDVVFARQEALSLAKGKGWGIERIVLALRSRKVPADIVRDTIAELRESYAEEEAASTIVKRRFSHIDLHTASPQEKQRLAGHLRRRGFSWETINRVMKL